MAVTNSKTISQSTFVYETEPICSPEDKYYLDRLFFGVESHDLAIIKSLSNEHLRQLCRVPRLFDSERLAPGKEKQTAYQRACLLGYTDIVQYMLEVGVTNLKTISQSTFVYETEPICSSEDKYYLDRLFFGVESHDLTIIKSFSSEHLRHLCRIRRLFDSEWLAPGKEKQTAYQRACLFGYTDIVQYMLEVGVTIEQLFSPSNTANVERSAFMFACQSGSLPTIRVLLQALSSEHIDHYKARNRSARCSISFARQYLIPPKSEIEALFSTENGLESVCPIHFAIARNDLELTRLIVTSANGELDTINDWKALRRGGFTPLHIACLFNRSLTMIKLLLSLGEANANPIFQTSEKGIFADQMTTIQEVIEYLRSKHLTDLEKMQSGRPYQIIIKPLSGQSLTLAVNGHTTTYELATYLEHECGLPHGGLRLIFRGLMIPTWFEASQPLIYYKIKKDSVLHIIWRNPKQT